MQFWELLLIAISLCFDSMAIAITCGLTIKANRMQKTMLVACTFASIQATVPLAGFLAGLLLEQFITGIDHWIALGLLSFIGSKMIYDSVKSNKENQTGKECKELTFPLIFLMGIATSMDALMVGVTFAFLTVNLLVVWITFWIVTFIVVFLGFSFGYRLGHYFKSGTGILGGLILISLGLKILIEDLYF
jgi:putative Mn2+ efflux pump MntP